MGGQGAPLAPLADVTLLNPADFYINLGGISNISFRDHENLIRSYDVGPCNQILNSLTHDLNLEFDAGGKVAASGTVISSLLRDLDALPYFSQTFPKSIDNNWITSVVWPLIVQTKGSVTDKLCTCTHHIAKQLATSIKTRVMREGAATRVLVTGGGAHNDFLLSLLSRYLEDKRYQICKPDTELINFKEAALMGLMAFLFVKGEINVFKEVTGASASHIGGCLYQAPGNPKRVHG